jgi:hypothetical protein
MQVLAGPRHPGLIRVSTAMQVLAGPHHSCLISVSAAMQALAGPHHPGLIRVSFYNLYRQQECMCVKEVSNSKEL